MADSGFRCAEMRSLVRVSWFVCLLTLALVLVPWGASFLSPAQANAGSCVSQGTTISFGPQTWNSDCEVTSTQTWGNGTLSLIGNLIVDSGATLTLWNMKVYLNPSSDQQYRIYVNGGQFVVRGGTLTSASTAYGWRLETSSATGVLVDLSGANISYAGSGGYSGFLLLGGNGHRFRHLTVTNSALGSSSGVVDVNGLGISDVRVENSTFTNTGPAFYVHAAAGGANLVFRDNTIMSYSGSSGGSALFAENTQILDNSISVGSAAGITLWGGGPGWPAKNAYNVSGNTITTTGQAITSSNSLGYDVTWNTIVNGHVALDGSGNRFAYNNVSGTDERVLRTHIVSTSSNSSFDHNTLWNVDLTGDSGFLVMNYGNVKVTDNRLFLNCYGPNCMGTEVINVQASQRPIYPGFPTVEVARNRITWMSIGSGGLTIMLDNEYSERVWLHDNTEAVAPGAGMPTSSMQGGGVQDSVYENNTVLGPTTFCIYEYINSAANNVFQNNRCNRGAHAGIFQTGGNVYRSNAFTNLTGPGIWICPNGPCAGSSTTNTVNNAWYNNTFTFATATPDLTLMSLGNALTNIFLGHGATHWTDGTNQYQVYGDWLFWSNAGISHLAFADRSDGHRTLSFTSGGATYWDREPAAGVTDNATLSVDGALDSSGSLNGGIVLRSLAARGNTSVVVRGTGPMTFTVRGFAPNYTYNLTIQNLGTGVYQNGVLAVDATGSAHFSLDFGTTSSQYALTLWGSFPTPPPPPDTTPPAQVTDLRVSSVGSGWAVLQWTAPGNNGSVGQASQYDIRVSTSGPINGTNFFFATPVSTPTPGPSGSTATLNVTGLMSGTTYWFALRTADNVPNWSPISNNANGTTSGLPRPAVESAQLNATANLISVVFSVPMNRTSVSGNLVFSQPVPYHLVWLDDRHLQLVLDTSLEPGVSYSLILAPTAASQAGVPLGSRFTYTFTGPRSSGRPPPPPPGTNPPGPPSDAWGILSWGVLTLAVLLMSSFVVFHLYPEEAATVLRSGAQRLVRQIRPHMRWTSRITWKWGRRPPAE